MHPSRAELEQKVWLGGSMVRVARDYGMPVTTLRNHMKKHASAGGAAAALATHAEPVVARVRRLVDRAERTLDALEAGDAETRGKQLAGMYREVRSAMELLGKMTGEFQTASVRRLIERCGAKDEDEVVAWCEDRKALSEMSLEDYFRDGCSMVRFCIEQRPEWAELAYRDAFPKLLPKSEAVEVTDESVAVVEEAGS